MQATETAVRKVVEEVLAQLGGGGANGRRFDAPAGYGSSTHDGVCATVDEAVAAAQAGFEQLRAASMETRAKAIQCVRDICESQAEELGRLEFEETKIGRLDHKIAKLQIVKLVPGIEFLRTDSVSGDNGLTVTEYAPFGVIGTITPVTHSLPTLAGNIINMVSAGNTVVCNPHPSRGEDRVRRCPTVQSSHRAGNGPEEPVYHHR